MTIYLQNNYYRQADEKEKFFFKHFKTFTIVPLRKFITLTNVGRNYTDRYSIVDP